MKMYTVAENFPCKGWGFMQLAEFELHKMFSLEKLFELEYNSNLQSVVQKVSSWGHVMQCWIMTFVFSDGFKWASFNLIIHSTWKKRRTLSWSAPLWWRTAKCTRTAWIPSWCSWKRWNVNGTRLSTNGFLMMALDQLTSCCLKGLLIENCFLHPTGFQIERWRSTSRLSVSDRQRQVSQANTRAGRKERWASNRNCAQRSQDSQPGVQTETDGQGKWVGSGEKLFSCVI